MTHYLPMSPTGMRMSAAERREQVLRAAIPLFARGGLAGTSTEDVATAAGISHPYLFRLFATKKALFLAAVERGFETVLAGFQSVSDAAIAELAEARAAEYPPGESGKRAALDAIGASYSAYLADRDLLLLQMQAYAASDDPDVRAVARTGFGRLWSFVEERSGAGPDELRDFFAMGMLFNVIASLDLAQFDARWAVDCVPPQDLSATPDQRAG
jgi:AcrR family transcriptional regulator